MQFFTTQEEDLNQGCCSTQPKSKMPCPLCHEEAKSILVQTLEHILKKEQLENLSCLDGFYYCKTPSCQAVYFRNREVIKQEGLKVIVGLKDGATPATMCYCFEWTKERIREELLKSGQTQALGDIKAKMKDPGCSCEVLNPSGGCCLADISKAIKELQEEK